LLVVLTPVITQLKAISTLGLSEKYGIDFRLLLSNLGTPDITPDPLIDLLHQTLQLQCCGRLDPAEIETTGLQDCTKLSKRIILNLFIVSSVAQSGYLKAIYRPCFARKTQRTQEP
jgi:hypothetical protein